MKNKKLLLIACFSVQNFKVSVESWKSYIVWNPGFRSAVETGERNDFKASRTRLFFIFLSNFWHIWWFFKFSACASLWKILKYGKNLAKKNPRKATFNFWLQLITLHGSSKTRNPSFGYPNSSLLKYHSMIVWQYVECTMYNVPIH